MSKRFKKFKIGSYEAEIKDYQYKSRPPVAVRIIGMIHNVPNGLRVCLCATTSLEWLLWLTNPGD